MRFGNTATVLAECKLKYYRTSECVGRVQVVHTSSNVEGQVYIPEANYMLLVISVAALAGFQNGNDIGNALSTDQHLLLLYLALPAPYCTPAICTCSL